MSCPLPETRTCTCESEIFQQTVFSSFSKVTGLYTPVLIICVKYLYLKDRGQTHLPVTGHTTKRWVSRGQWQGLSAVLVGPSPWASAACRLPRCAPATVGTGAEAGLAWARDLQYGMQSTSRGTYFNSCARGLPLFVNFTSGNNLIKRRSSLNRNLFFKMLVLRAQVVKASSELQTIFYLKK